MPVIVSNRSSRAVVIDRERAAAIVQHRPSAVQVDDRRTSQAVQRRTAVVGVSSPGPQGRPGAPGGTSEARIADGVLGGHRIVRSTGAQTVGYASSDSSGHGDDTIGMTLGAAADGAEVQVQRTGTVSHNGWNWTPGEPVFLGLDGLPTQIPPDTVDGVLFVQVIGHAESPTALYLAIEPPTYLED